MQVDFLLCAFFQAFLLLFVRVPYHCKGIDGFVDVDLPLEFAAIELEDPDIGIETRSDQRVLCL